MALRQFWEKTGQQGRIGWQPSISVADHMGLPNDLRDLSEMGILMDVTHHETPHGVGYGTAWSDFTGVLKVRFARLHTRSERGP